MKAKFLQAVEEGNLTAVRFFLSNELLLDPRGGTFWEMKAYAESHCPGLYDTSDEIDYPVDGKVWNLDSLFEIKNELDRHFTKDRLALYEMVAKIVLKEKALHLDEKNKDQLREEKVAEIPQTPEVAKRNLKPYIGMLIAGLFVVLLGVLAKVKAFGIIIGCLVLVSTVIVLLTKSSKK